MSAHTKPSYYDPDTQTSVALQNGTAVGDTDTTASRVDQNGTSTVNNISGVAVPVVDRGLVQNIYGKLSSAGGVVVVSYYVDAARTRLVAQASLDFTGVTEKAQALALPGGDFHSGLFWDALGDATSATKTIDVRPTIAKVA